MPLTEDSLEVVTTCYLAEQAGKVYSPNPEWFPACEEAHGKGWLSRELRDEGLPAYALTPAAHTALGYAERRN